MMLARRVLYHGSLILALSAVSGFAQNSSVPAASQTTPEEQGGPLHFHVGPFAIAPYIRLGQVALDTNVYYTPEDRKTDLTASGGPGLRISLPIGKVGLYVDGNVNYYWFARTQEERRFGGAAGGGFEWNASAFHLGISRFLTRSYERPSIEVDRRVLRNTWDSGISLDMDLSRRFRVEPTFSISNRRAATGTQFLGADLSSSLTEDRYRAELQLKYGLTPKTDFVILTDQEWSRFPKATTRDVDSNRLGGGIALESETRLTGSVIGGVRFFRPQVPGGTSFTRPFVRAGLELVGQKTRMGVGYSLETAYSAFDSQRPTLPTLDTQQAHVTLIRRFGRVIEVNLGGGLETLKNNVPVVIRRQGGSEVIRRDDQFYNASLDLGFRIRERFRLGLVATYNERQSNHFADFGVDSLLLGASVRFNPGGVDSAGGAGGGAAASRRPRRSP